MPRDFKLSRNGSHPREQMGTGGRSRADDAHRTGVWRRSGKGPEADDETYVEATGGVGDDVDEVAPVEVRLGTHEKEMSAPSPSRTEAQLDLRPGQFGRDAIDDARDRSPGALVDEVLGVERASTSV